MAEIAVTAPLPGGLLEELAAAHTVRIASAGRPLSGAELATFVGSAHALISNVTDNVDASRLAGCPNLKVIANFGVGVDHIDLDAARRVGLWVTNTPDVLTEATADLTWALILAVTRRVVEGDRLIRTGDAWGWRPDFFLGAGLQDKTLGVVGMGRIGRAVARRAAAFGMVVCYHDRGPVSGDEGATFVGELASLLACSQVLTLHCPLTPATRHLLDATHLRLLPRGAFVVNTSRGPVIDEGALVEALEAGHLGGAALDVYENEPAVHPRLVGRADVVLVPHLGSATLETRTAMARLAMDNALAVLNGRRPPSPVVEPGR